MSTRDELIERLYRSHKAAAESIAEFGVPDGEREDAVDRARETLDALGPDPECEPTAAPDAQEAPPLPSAEREARLAMEQKLREALADLCGLRDTISDDVMAFDIGRHPETGEWRVWHEDYPDEGSLPLTAVARPPAAASAAPEAGRPAPTAEAPHYDGSGRLKHYCTKEHCPDFNENSMMAVEAKCPVCEGRGWGGPQAGGGKNLNCGACGGTGRVGATPSPDAKEDKA